MHARWSFCAALLSLACTGKEDTGDTRDTSATGPRWSVLADGVGEGVLLSAWTDGGEALMVGGGMAGDGPGVLARYDGSRVCTETLSEDRALWWIHGPVEGEWYAVGERGLVLHQVGGEIFDESIETEATFYGVWATEDVVFAVGGVVDTNLGQIWRREAGVWSLFLDNIDGVVFKVWRGWFVGNEWAAFLDGESSEDLSVHLPGHRLLTVRGPSEDEVWAVGGSASAVVLHWDQGAWQTLGTQGLSLPLNGIWTAEGEQVWVAGMSGTQGYGPGDGSWHIPDFPVTAEHFHAVWKHGEEMLFLGGNLMSSQGPYYGTIGRYGPDSDSLDSEDCL